MSNLQDLDIALANVEEEKTEIDEELIENAKKARVSIIKRNEIKYFCKVLLQKIKNIDQFMAAIDAVQKVLPYFESFEMHDVHDIKAIQDLYDLHTEKTLIKLKLRKSVETFNLKLMLQALKERKELSGDTFGTEEMIAVKKVQRMLEINRFFGRTQDKGTSAEKLSPEDFNSFERYVAYDFLSIPST